MSSSDFLRSDLTSRAQSIREERSPQHMLGRVLDGRFRLLEVLGTGGMGHVYRAQHVALGKDLAIKVLLPEFAADQEHKIRFLREARAISQIGHENVVDVTDFGVAEDGSLYLVMELLRGEGLGELLRRRGVLAWPEAKPMILQICKAIAAAHAHGILHRDIKPENCFRVAPAGHGPMMKVLDFGLAKIVGGQTSLDASLTGVGRVLGTAEYMSPERVCEQPLDARGDVYSLGVLIYEMVTGSVPFSGEHYTVVFDQHLHAPPRPPSEVARRRPGAGPIPHRLEHEILRALAKNPADRHQSVNELLAALAAVEDSATATQSRRRERERMRTRGARRERHYIALIYTLSTLLVIAVAILAYLLFVVWPR